MAPRNNRLKLANLKTRLEVAERELVYERERASANGAEILRQRTLTESANRRADIVGKANNLLRSRVGMLRGQLAMLTDSTVACLRNDLFSEDLMHATHPGNQNEQMATPMRDRTLG